MSLSLGNTTIGSLYLGSTKVGEAYLGNVKVYASTPVDPDNPLNLPPYTIRVKFVPGYTPTQGDSRTQVSESPNVWDITKNSTSWTGLLGWNSTKVLEVLGANSTGVTDMSSLFYGFMYLTSVTQLNTKDVTNLSEMFSSCPSLTSIPILDTRSATNMSNMFVNCISLTSVPLLNTSSATNMRSMFNNCTAIESGALALYQQASTQATPPSQHDYCFNNCGSNTVTGAAELAQIPSSWGGTGT